MVGERALPSRSQMIAELIRHELAERSAGVARPDLSRRTAPRISPP
jgi:CopG family nickel-responsive transcriptional regulator